MPSARFAAKMIVWSNVAAQLAGTTNRSLAILLTVLAGVADNAYGTGLKMTPVVVRMPVVDPMGVCSPHYRHKHGPENRNDGNKHR
jgi:hypothetical protein